LQTIINFEYITTVSLHAVIRDLFEIIFQMNLIKYLIKYLIEYSTFFRSELFEIIVKLSLS